LNAPPTNPRLAKYLDFIRSGAQVGATQILVQAIGFASGILIIRFLSPEKYTLYTLAYTFLGAMSVLADGGIGKGVMAQGGRVWKDREKLGAVLATGLRLRRIFSLGAIALVLPALAFMLRKHGATWTEVILLEAAVLPLFYAQLSDSLLGIIPKLHQRIGPLQGIEIKVNIARLTLLLLVLFTLPYAAAIIATTGVTTVWSNRMKKRLTGRLCDLDQGEDREVRKSILKVVRRIIPGSVYYFFSESLSIWLISIFGESQSVASVGALERIAKIMVVFHAINGFLIIPRFARMPEAAGSLLVRFVQVQGIAVSIGACVLVAFYLFPGAVLWILGDGYQHLDEALIVQAAIMATRLIGGSAGSLASARGWILHPVLLISTQVAAQIVGILVFDCSTVTGVLYVSLLSSATLLVVRHLYVLYVIRQLPPSP